MVQFGCVSLCKNKYIGNLNMSVEVAKKKSITICGSMNVINRMLAIGHELEKRGFSVLLPNVGETNDYSSMSEVEQTSQKHQMILDHLEKIKRSDAILVANEKLKDVDGYIGANTFLEMGFAFALGKNIYLLNSIPEQSNKVEIMGLLPIVLNGEIEKIGNYEIKKR